MKERGNILFLILLAVILFAALSYAVTSSMKGGGNNASEEKTKAMVASIFQYASLIENAVMRLRLVNGCSDTRISFENNVVVNPIYANPNSPSSGSKKCWVFHPDGGNVPFIERRDWQITREEAVALDAGYGVHWDRAPGFNVTALNGIQNAGTDAADLLFRIPFIKPELCEEINRQLTGSTTTTSSLGHTGTLFNGTYTATSILPLVTPLSGCARQSGFAQYIHVILAR